MKVRGLLARIEVRWGLLLLLLGLATVFSIRYGSVSIRWTEIWQSLTTSQDHNASTSLIVWEIRLPRAILGGLVGAALAASGAAYQGLFRNPLADPFVIGSAAGAAFGATLILIYVPVSLGGKSAVPIGAFLGAVGATSCVFIFATLGTRGSLIQLLLAGTAMSSFLSSMVWLLLSLNDQSTMQVLAWLMGSLAGKGWDGVVLILPYALLGVGSLWVAARPLDALTLGEDTARGLGLPIRFATAWIVAAASFATAGAVAVGGIIGFVGLIAPHLARRLCGPRHAVLVPTAALCGGLLLMLADLIARTVVAPTELPVGVLTALVGGPFFLIVLWKLPKP